MFAVAIMLQRHTCLTHLLTRGRVILTKNCDVKYSVFSNTRSAVFWPVRHRGSNQSVHRPNLLSFSPPTHFSALNFLVFQACRENSLFSRQNKRNRSSFSKDKDLTLVLEEGTLAMGLWSLGLGAIGAAVAGIILANTDYFLTKPSMASVDYLENADLRTIDNGEKSFKAKALWEKSGAVIMAVRRPGWFLCREEAAGLSSLKPQLQELGVPLYAVVKEKIGTEIQDFRPHFAGDIFLDEAQAFYGPQQRKMGGLGFIRIGVWQNFIRAWKSGYQGNMNGEGFILGGVFVIGSGKQGVLLEHREKEFGDKVSNQSVLEAARKIIVEK